MAFDWLTFGFEIVNFLVLVWLLHRLLYRPVLAMIQRRRDDIAASTQSAEALRAEAEQLKAEYDRRLEDWAGERAKARRELDEELERERQRRLQELEAELAERRQREAALREREAAELRRASEREALALAGRFAARLLAVCAGPDLEARLLRLLVQQLGALPAQRRAALREALRTASAPLQVTSAYCLDDTQRAELARALAALADDGTPAIDYGEDPALLAGLRLQVGAWQLGANLQDELQAFTELVPADG
jgi:F-type H+-transporting ATPase subunit b